MGKRRTRLLSVAAALAAAPGRVSPGERVGLQYVLLSLVYNDRIAAADPRFRPTSWSIHRLVMVGIVLAAKFLDDELFTAAGFAEIGGVGVKDMCRMEVAFCRRIKWRLHVAPEEAAAYGRLVTAGRPGGGDANAAPPSE